jgi:glucose-6-phosphate dehydrogenase assembly protein OpcA
MTAANLARACDAWQGTAVDVDAIEAALMRQWKEAGQHQQGGPRHPPIRTSVMNLVVYVPREEDAARATDAIAGLTEQHPSRTICVVADPSAATSTLDASVTTQCSEAASGRLCWEQITIVAHGATAAHAPAVVIPLLLPDLPVYLWWMGDAPLETALFRRMADLCDRLIVDSSFFTRPITGLVELAAVPRQEVGERGLGDFNWMRLTPWRTLMAQFFDGEELRPYAYGIDGVRLGYAHDGSGHGGVGQALLLAGWLSSCLGWSPRPQTARRRGGAIRLEAERPAEGASATVAIDVEPRPATGAAAGDLVSLTMTAMRHGVPGVFTIERRAGSAEATTTTAIDGTPGAARTVRMVSRRLGELLCEELEMFHRDRLYEAALAAAAALAQGLVTEQ